jgi:hypothetical protein
LGEGWSRREREEELRESVLIGEDKSRKNGREKERECVCVCVCAREKES